MVPASGPLPVTTVPAASISAVTPTSSAVSTRRSMRTSPLAGPSPSPARTYSTTAAARIADDSRKCTATKAGLSLVSTTIPPTTAWPTMPSGSAADSQTRSRRRCPPGRYCQQAMNASPQITTSGKFSSRLLNSIAVFRLVCPTLCAATTLVWVHCGQSGQPSPDDDSRTASPVEMMTALAITAASASPRTEYRVGRRTGPVTRANQEDTPHIVTPGG